MYGSSALARTMTPLVGGGPESGMGLMFTLFRLLGPQWAAAYTARFAISRRSCQTQFRVLPTPAFDAQASVLHLLPCPEP